VTLLHSFGQRDTGSIRPSPYDVIIDYCKQLMSRVTAGY